MCISVGSICCVVVLVLVDDDDDANSDNVNSIELKHVVVESLRCMRCNKSEVTRTAKLIGVALCVLWIDLAPNIWCLKNEALANNNFSVWKRLSNKILPSFSLSLLYNTIDCLWDCYVGN